MMGLMFSVQRSAQAAIKRVASMRTTRALSLDQWTTAPWSLKTLTHRDKELEIKSRSIKHERVTQSSIPLDNTP